VDQIIRADDCNIDGFVFLPKHPFQFTGDKIDHEMDSAVDSAEEQSLLKGQRQQQGADKDEKGGIDEYVQKQVPDL